MIILALGPIREELSAQGNGGQRQMYNYSESEGIQGTIETPLETDSSDNEIINGRLKIT